MTNKLHTILLVIFALSACSQTKKSFESPVGYNFNTPERIDVPEDLVEISGITFAAGNDKTMYAIQDEDAKVYSLNEAGIVTAETQFGKHGDFEDIAVIDNNVIILRSDGTFFSFPLSHISSGKIDSVKVQKGLLPPGEYEGLYARKDTKEIYALCKNCQTDKKQESLSGYVIKINAEGNLINQSSFTIATSEIFKKLDSKKTKFSPSALAFNSISKEWYVLSSVNKALVILDENWVVKNVYRLNASLFNQPEGIIFDESGNLFISNEGGKNGTGTILKFKLQHTVR